MFMPLQSHRSNRRAFTLVEILVVLVIIGISAAMIIPSIGSRDDLNTAAMARVVMADLIYAQNRAVSLQRTVYVRFDPDNQRYEVLDAIDPAVVITHPVEKTPFQVRLGAQRGDDLRYVTLAAADFDGNRVLAFDELGAPVSYNPDAGTATPMVAGRVELRSNDYALTVRVEPYSGELRTD